MTMSFLRAAPQLVLAALSLVAVTALAQTPNGEAAAYGPRDDVMRFADELAQRHPQLDATWLRAQLQRARKVETVRKLIMPPAQVNGKATAKNWAAYRARFLDSERIAAGAAFWRANQVWLERAEQRWGVPAQVIVGVIGVETYYGRLTGTFRVIDALATLSFDFPTGRRDRTPFFRGELEQFLVWCARERCDPAQVQGSFAGAMGLPQFMPGSINRWAVDFDGDGHVNLAGSAPDAIGSVARYLHYFGWQRGLPTHFDVRAPDNAADRALLLGPDILPLFSAEEFSRARRHALGRRPRPRRPVGSRRTAQRRHRRAEPCGGHAQLLGGDALQLVELLRAGSDRSRRRRGAAHEVTALQRIFVYGTLKQGFRNFGVNHGRRVPGEFVTLQTYPLYVIGEFGLPWLVHEPGQGLRVSGQVFEVDDAALAAMDALERVQDAGWYTRRALEVQQAASGEVIAALAYFGSAERLRSDTVHLGPLAEYTQAHQALYRKHL